MGQRLWLTVHGKADTETQFVPFVDAVAFINTGIPIPGMDFTVPAVAELPALASLGKHVLIRTKFLQGPKYFAFKEPFPSDF